MSYSALILKDSPQCIWSLEETSGTSVLPDAFVSDTAYYGEYNTGKFFRSLVPITYGGKVAISNIAPYDDITADYVTDNVMFSVPSLGKFSSREVAKSHSLEFWMNLDVDYENIDQNHKARIGESYIVKLSGATNTGLLVKDFEYLVFRLGDTGKKAYESYVHVYDFNQPLHIVLVYTSLFIQVIVNGIPGTVAYIDETPFNEYEERSINFLFPDRISSNSPYFKNINFDTVAIYNHQLTTSISKRHYVYGLGYNFPKAAVSKNGGTMYSSDLQTTLFQKNINYSNYQTWSSRATMNNLFLSNDGLYTKKYSSPTFIISAESKTAKISDMISNDSFIFPENYYSYIEINNYEEITDGNTKKIEAKFKLPISTITSEEQLMYIGSKSNVNKYISATINGRVVSVEYNDGIDSGAILSHTIHSTATDFYISITKDNLEVNITVCDDQNDKTQDFITTTNLFPLSDSYVRFGSAPIFFGNAVPENVLLEDTKRFSGSLLQVDISDLDTITNNWSSYPDRMISNKYQLYADSTTKRYKIATVGSFSMTLSLIDFVGLEKIGTLANDIKLAIKSQIGSNSALILYTLNDVNSLTPIQSDIDIRNIHLPSVGAGISAEQLEYNIAGTIYSSDCDSSPGKLSFIRLYTYPVEEDVLGTYVKINSDSVGNNLKYYSGSGPFRVMPDLQKTTDMYRSFNTGIKVGSQIGSTPYLLLDYNLQNSLDLSDTKIYSLMFSAICNSGLQEDINLLNVETPSISIGWSTTLEGANNTLYINGERYDELDTYNVNTWNHYTVVFPSGIDYDNIIKFGYLSDAGFSVDNIVVYTKPLSDDDILDIYSRYFSEKSLRYGDGGDTLASILIKDKELSDDETIYQPLDTQSSFLSLSSCPSLASVSGSNYSIVQVGSTSDYNLTYGTNKDLIRIDNVEIKVGDVVLLKDQTTSSQNGIYIATAKAGGILTLTKQTSPSNGSVIFVTSGNSNKNYYFIKNNNSYTKTLVQRKIVGYNKTNHNRIWNSR